MKTVNILNTSKQTVDLEKLNNTIQEAGIENSNDFKIYMSSETAQALINKVMSDGIKKLNSEAVVIDNINNIEKEDCIRGEYQRYELMITEKEDFPFGVIGIEYEDKNV